MILIPDGTNSRGYISTLNLCGSTSWTNSTYLAHMRRVDGYFHVGIFVSIPSKCKPKQHRSQTKRNLWNGVLCWLNRNPIVFCIQRSIHWPFSFQSNSSYKLTGCLGFLRNVPRLQQISRFSRKLRLENLKIRYFGSIVAAVSGFLHPFRPIRFITFNCVFHVTSQALFSQY